MAFCGHGMTKGVRGWMQSSGGECSRQELALPVGSVGHLWVMLRDPHVLAHLILVGGPVPFLSVTSKYLHAGGTKRWAHGSP